MVTHDKVEKKALHIFVYGRVQGVGFRSWTVSLACSLFITGWVHNTEKYDCVEILAEGSPSNLNEFLLALKSEHPHANVELLEKFKVDIMNYKRFNVIM